MPNITTCYAAAVVAPSTARRAPVRSWAQVDATLVLGTYEATTGRYKQREGQLRSWYEKGVEGLRFTAGTRPMHVSLGPADPRLHPRGPRLVHQRLPIQTPPDFALSVDFL
eukprot:3941730-Rhodomonas_salina.2